MNQREKILLYALLGTLALFVVVPWVWDGFRKPIAEQEDKLASLQEKLEAEDERFQLSLEKLNRLKDYKARSLSSNPAQGALAYQQWLTDLAEIVARFNKIQVTRERITPSKDNSHVSVRTKLMAEGTLDQLRTFLFRFHRANVLHHISSLKLEALDHSREARLKIDLEAEALSLREAIAPEFATLFPRTSLVDDIAEKSAEIRVASTKHFPSQVPFEVRIGDQYVTIDKVTESTWHLVLADGQTLKGQAGTQIELSEVHPDFAKKAPQHFDEMLKLNPFAKPVPYRPRLDLIGEKTLQRGSSLQLEPKASGFDPQGGAPTYSVVGDLLPGMKFDAGKLHWNPPADVKAGTFKVSFKATAPALKAPLEATFDLTLKDVNTAPKVTAPKDLVATIGQPLTVKIEASDTDTPAGKLKFKLNDPKPEGLAINELTGELTFTPAASVNPGAVTVAVAVSDDGSPPQTTTVSLQVTVQDDTAQFTFLTASVSADTERQAWLYDRSKNARLILKEGKPLKYAGFDALVKTIGKDYVLFEQKQQLWRLNVGQSLKEARQEPVAAATPVTAKPSEQSAPPMPEDKRS